MLWVFCIFILETIKDIGDVSWLKITVIGITGLVGVTSAFRFYLDSTRQVYIHRSRFPDNNAHKLKKCILLLNYYNVTIISPVGGRLPHGRQ